MLVRLRKGQSILEYALLIAVVVAAILVMQVFVKRGYQGNLKDSAGRMGDQFSATDTTTKQRVISEGQNITEVTASSGADTGLGAVVSNIGTTLGGDVAEDTLASQAYSISIREAGNQTVTSASRTDAAAVEINKMNFDPAAETGGTHNYIEEQAEALIPDF